VTRSLSHVVVSPSFLFFIPLSIPSRTHRRGPLPVPCSQYYPSPIATTIPSPLPVDPPLCMLGLLYDNPYKRASACHTTLQPGSRRALGQHLPIDQLRFALQAHPRLCRFKFEWPGDFFSLSRTAPGSDPFYDGISARFNHVFAARPQISHFMPLFVTSSACTTLFLANWT
jgi:hypothetical protein